MQFATLASRALLQACRIRKRLRSCDALSVAGPFFVFSFFVLSSCSYFVIMIVIVISIMLVSKLGTLMSCMLPFPCTTRQQLGMEVRLDSSVSSPPNRY